MKTKKFKNVVECVHCESIHVAVIFSSEIAVQFKCKECGKVFSKEYK